MNCATQTKVHFIQMILLKKNWGLAIAHICKCRGGLSRLISCRACVNISFNYKHLRQTASNQTFKGRWVTLGILCAARRIP